MSREESCRHKHLYPCSCAMGHLYRFVEPVVLLLLKQKGRSYGYDLSSNLYEYSFTDAEIEGAALYRTLRRLEKNRYVSSHWKTSQGRPARRVYALTSRGDQHLREWAQVLRKVAGSMDRFVRVVNSLPVHSGQRGGRQKFRTTTPSARALGQRGSDE
jgi:PadR family transcriptional regulator PadR